MPCLPDNAEGWTLAVQLRGSRVSLRVAQRGDNLPSPKPEAQCAGCARAAQAERAGDFTARLLRCKVSRTRWALPKRRCASSASTSATSSAPTWWRRWWCSRTDCRASPTTATMRSGRLPAKAWSGDVASIAEVTRRRFYRHLHDTQHPTELAPEGKSRSSLPAQPVCGRWWRPAGQRGRGGARRSSASPTSRSSGWLNGWRRCGCRQEPDPDHHAAQQRRTLSAVAGA